VSGAAAPFAALRMYDLPEIRPAVDVLGAAILRAIPGAPAGLDWDGAFDEQWLDPGLVLGQSCGWPLVHDLAGRVGVVGAFSYGEASDGGACYRSVLVAREAEPLESFAGTRAAISGYNSLSGWVSLGAAVAPHAGGRAFFGSVTVTGAHVASLAAMQRGDVDIAAIDGITFALLRIHRPAAVAGLHVVGRGPQIPTLPLITAGDVGVVRAAVAAGVTDPATAAARATLLVDGFVPLGLDAYDGVPALAELAMVTVPPESR
jgi:ABC-type phosphate/phosphonate transport system substrate-binding protein